MNTVPDHAAPLRTTESRKWYAATPLHFMEGPLFWERDSGLFSKGFSAAGFDSKLVLLGDPDAETSSPVVLGSKEDLASPDFWKSIGADGVVFYSWAAPAYEPIARAIKASGAKLVLKLDSDGVKCPRVSFWLQLVRAVHSGRDVGHSFPALRGVLHTLALQLFPSLHDEGMIRHMEHADVIGIEFPVAQARLRRLLRSYGREDLARRVAVIPHPVTEDAIYDGTVPKDRRIIAVGRWQSSQKDAPMLIRVLGDALKSAPDYTAEIFGAGEEVLGALASKLPAEVRNRVLIQGKVNHGTLVERFQGSQILFMPSRWEGFPNTASEAVCCGCSVVGAARVGALGYFAGRASGTLAPFRTHAHLLDALNSEIHEWHSGARDPRTISQSFRHDLSTERVIQQTLEAVAARSATGN